jgi:PAS domain S-box-containing protein
MGMEERDVVGHNALDFAADRDAAQRIAENDRLVVESGKSSVVEELLSGSGGPRTYLTTKSPLRDEQGRTIGVIGVATDITDRKRAERELEALVATEQRLRAEAERANRAKDEFLAIVSHELRSPLNALRGWGHLLATTRPLDASLVDRATKAIKRNVEHQARLIDDLLDTSRLISGKLTLERQPLNLVEVVHAALEVVRPAATAKHVALDAAFDHPVVTVEGDAGRLQQIITNMLSNAIKFTPEHGRIETSVRLVGDRIQLAVRDNGVGIAPEFLPHVFDRFSQADTSTTRRAGGLGIGLALVRHLVELHGGTVRAESLGAGQGATFTVELPAPPAGAWAMRAPAAAGDVGSADGALDKLKIYVVDDDVDAREIVGFALRQAGAKVETFESGDDLAARLRGTVGTAPPDLLLLDLAMPGEDGFAVMTRVRSIEATAGVGRERAIPGIAVTAFTQVDRSRLAAAGFQELVGKPIDADRLIATIRAVLGARVPGDAATARRAAAAAATRS